jgi:hypothetical protein
MAKQHALQAEDSAFNPEEYFRTIPAFDADELDSLALDYVLAQELFYGDYELSITCEQSEMSKRDFEGNYFESGLNILDNKFIRNFDDFQLRHPPKPLARLRSNTVNLVGFGDEGRNRVRNHSRKKCAEKGR